MSEKEETTSERMSVSDNELSSSKKRRRVRRRRGNGRVRPSSAFSPEIDDDGSCIAKKKCERLAMAPSNTTQFLLDDREARVEQNQESGGGERMRIRSISVGSERLNGSWGPSEQCSSSGDDDIDQEFETEYLEVKRERIEKMSKSQLEQELLERDRDTETLYDQCEKINSENRQLKELLMANGIQFETQRVSSTTSNGVAKASPSTTTNTSPRVTAN